MIAGSVNATETGQSAETSFLNAGVGNEHCGSGVCQLIADLALATTGIQQCGDSANEGGRVVGSAEFPGIWQVDREEFSRLQTCLEQSVGEFFDKSAVLGVRDS